MTSFILIALLITLVVIALLVWPLRKNRHSVSYARQAQNIHYAKERIDELEQQLNNASISATDYEALKAEIESTLADDIDIANQSVDAESAHAPKSNKFLISILCAFIPLAAVGFYALTGTPESFSIAKQSKQQFSEQEVSNIIASVEQRLKENPDDIEGWQVLSRSYVSLGRFEDAKRALQKLIELKGESPDLLVTLADATRLAAGGSMIGEPSNYVQRALTLAPNHPQALWMAGVSAMESNNPRDAINYWNALIPQLEGLPQQQQELRDLITETKQQVSLNDPTLAVGKNNENELPEIQKNTSDISGLRVIVTLDPSLKIQTSPSDLVFVFAKATQGPPAPLAVKRLTVADLPASIILNDADAMLAQFKLSLFENVSISARVAKTGNPIAQTGDLESNKVDVKNSSTETINITISSIVQ